ncbi:MAG: iron ABC transporter permease [Spirochaetales bacterium]|nr:iron ABC transporter permease [Spirochaetales bacterium]
MNTKDKFRRTYPAIAIVLLFILCLAPAVMEWISGADSVLSVFSDIPTLINLGNSVLFAVICVLVSVVLGLPGAYIMAKFRFPLKGFFRWILTFLMLLPVSVLALSTRFILQKTGLQSINPLIPIGLVLVMSNTPLVVYFVGSRWIFLDDNCESCARSLGTKPAKVFFSITTPRMRSEIAFSASLAFIRCFSDIAAFKILGDGSQTVNTCTFIYNLWQSGNQHAAQALSLAPFVITYIALMVMFLDSWKDISREKRAVVAKTFISKLFTAIYLLVCLAVFVSPFVVFAITILSGSPVSSISGLFGSLKAPGTGSLLYSAIISVSAALICTFLSKRLSFAIARNAFPTTLAFLPLTFGAAVLSMGFSLIGKLLPFVNPLILAILATVARFIPVAVLVLLSAILGIPEDFSNVSRTLGFNARYSFRNIDSVLLRPSFIESFFVVTFLSFGEFGTPAFLSGNTVPTQLVKLLESGDSIGACIMAAIILLVSIVFYSVAYGLHTKGTSNA